jgi:hypothetical protein
VSHSSRDSIEALALKTWLERAEPGLVGEVVVEIVRPKRAVLSGERGLANAIHKLRTGLGLAEPMLGEIKNACHPQHVERLRGWLAEAGQVARARLLDVAAELPAPTILVPVDQVEEPGLPDEGQRGNVRHHLRDARNRADHPVPLSGRYQRERLSP